MNGPLRITPSEMVAHGGNIDAIAGKLGTASGTANTTSAADGAAAYGPLFAPFVIPVLTAAEEAAKGFITAATQTAGAQGQAACGLAQTFTDTDENGRQRVEQTTEGMSTSDFPGAQT